MEDDDLQIDPLFVGLTRPATVAGVNYFAFVFEVIAIAVIFLGTANVLYLLLVIPLHGVLYLITAKDAGAFGSIEQWVKTSGRCRNRAFWKATSFSPLPNKRWDR